MTSQEIAAAIKDAFMEGFGSYQTPCSAYNTSNDAWGESDAKVAHDAILAAPQPPAVKEAAPAPAGKRGFIYTYPPAPATLNDVDALMLMEPFDLKLDSGTKLAIVRAVLHAAGNSQGLKWQPMETAPKDKRILLCRRWAYKDIVVGGHWQKDEFAKKPRPYWGHDQERVFGTLDARKNPPIGWMPEPAFPSAPVGDSHGS